jgi:hypothetical protein
MTLDGPEQAHWFTALEYKKIKKIEFQYPLYVQGIYHVYTGSWYRHSKYMVYTVYNISMGSRCHRQYQELMISYMISYCTRIIWNLALYDII